MNTATRKAFRACLPGDRNSCINCADYSECPLAVCGGTKGSWVCDGCSALETNVGYAIDAAWNWFHTGYMNNFISKDPETKLLNLNW